MAKELLTNTAINILNLLVLPDSANGSSSSPSPSSFTYLNSSSLINLNNNISFPKLQHLLFNNSFFPLILNNKSQQIMNETIFSFEEEDYSSLTTNILEDIEDKQQQQQLFFENNFQLEKNVGCEGFGEKNF
ncbi:unnamed protein product [Meloidogyne enterolobii]|uniref:Uncharacterized protein n=1 Tax=Meloidogyne enterolobii TaxID=390850 RepID=A0ACB1AR68_MELEN